MHVHSATTRPHPDAGPSAASGWARPATPGTDATGVSHCRTATGTAGCGGEAWLVLGAWSLAGLTVLARVAGRREGGARLVLTDRTR